MKSKSFKSILEFAEFLWPRAISTAQVVVLPTEGPAYDLQMI